MNTNRQPLTTKQRQAYESLVSFFLERGYSASIRDCMDIWQLKSPAPVTARLARLQAKGWINWVPGQARTITFTGYRAALEAVLE